MLETTAQKPSTTYRALIYNRNFSLLWVAMSISLSGDVLFNLAINWLILEKTGSAISVGGNLIVGVFSNLFFRSLAGALADRWKRRAMMIGSDLLRASVLILLFIFLKNFSFNLWSFYLATFLLSMFSNFFFPAYRATLPNLLPTEALITGRALTTASARLITTFVSAISGFLLMRLGTDSAILFDALSFLFSAGLLSLCHIPQVKISTQQTYFLRDLAVNIWDGLRYISQQRILLSVFMLITLGDFGAAFIWPVHVVFIERVFHGGPELYGALASASLLGSIAGALYLGRFSKWFNRNPGYSYCLAASVWGISALLFGMNTSLPLAFLYRFLIGASLSVLSIPLASLVDNQTNDAFRGRVGATMSLGSQLVSPFAVTLSGWMADTWNPRLSYLTAGSLLLFTAMLSLLLPGIRQAFVESQPVKAC